MSVDLGIVDYCSENPPVPIANNLELSIKSGDTSMFSVYPNPASNALNIRLLNSEIDAKAELFTITGQRIKNTALTQLRNQLNTSDLSDGLYILRISDRDGRVLKTDRIIIQQ